MTGRHEPERDFETRLRARLAEQVEDIDEATREQLRVARRAALDQLVERTPAGPRWLAGGALAASLALIAVFAVVRDDQWPDVARSGNGLIAASAEADDLDLMYADEDLEMIEELEFLRWLDPNGDPG